MDFKYLVIIAIIWSLSIIISIFNASTMATFKFMNNTNTKTRIDSMAVATSARSALILKFMWILVVVACIMVVSNAIKEADMSKIVIALCLTSSNVIAIVVAEKLFYTKIKKEYQ